MYVYDVPVYVCIYEKHGKFESWLEVLHKLN